MRPTNGKLIVPACGLFVFLAISFAPTLFTTWFHLVHGSHFSYADKSILVPLRWHAKIEGGKAYISKFSCTVFAKSPASGLISFWPVESPPKTEAEKDLLYQSFASVYWTYLASGGGETIGPIRKGSGDNEAVCMETTIRKDKWMSSTCLIFRGSWNASFLGDPKELGTFYEIVGNSKNSK